VLIGSAKSGSTKHSLNNLRMTNSMAKAGPSINSRNKNLNI